jgi:hypothetical protein
MMVLNTVKEAPLPLAIAGLWKDEKQPSSAVIHFHISWKDEKHPSKKLKGIRAKDPFLTREL